MRWLEETGSPRMSGTKNGNPPIKGFSSAAERTVLCSPVVSPLRRPAGTRNYQWQDLQGKRRKDRLRQHIRFGKSKKTKRVGDFSFLVLRVHILRFVVGTSFSTI